MGGPPSSGRAAGGGRRHPLAAGARGGQEEAADPAARAAERAGEPESGHVRGAHPGAELRPSSAPQPTAGQGSLALPLPLAKQQPAPNKGPGSVRPRRGAQDKVLGGAMPRDFRSPLAEERGAQPLPLEGHGRSGTTPWPGHPRRSSGPAPSHFGESGEGSPCQSPWWLTHSYGH